MPGRRLAQVASFVVRRGFGVDSIDGCRPVKCKDSLPLVRWSKPRVLAVVAGESHQFRGRSCRVEQVQIPVAASIQFCHVRKDRRQSKSAGLLQQALSGTVVSGTLGRSVAMPQPLANPSVKGTCLRQAPYVER